jgi:hypothetical protein
VLCAAVLRLRLLAAPAAWLLAAGTAALLPGSHSPYTLDIVHGMTDLGLPVEQTAMVLPESLLVTLLLLALYALRRRRID